MRKNILLFLFALIFYGGNLYSQTCTQTFTASGNDSDPTLVTITPADITCTGGGTINSITLVNSAGSLISGNCPSWYTFNLVVDGVPVVTAGCDDQLNGQVISPTFSTIVVSSNDADVYSDFVTITFDLQIGYTPPACPSPTTGVSSNLTASTADLNWTESGSATAWNVEVGLPGFTPGTGASVASVTGVASKPWTATGLSSGTVYQFYVQSNCGGPLSLWSGPYAFTTQCDVFTTNYTEGFEATTAPPTCWTMAYANASPPAGNLMTHSTTQFHSGARSFRFSSYSSGTPYNQYLISPEMNYSTGKILSFWYRKSNTSTETFSVGTSTTGNNYTTDFIWSADITDALNTAWTEYTVTIPAGTKYIAIQYKSDYMYYLYVDDFSISDIPACPSPTGLTALNIGQTSADLDWADGTGSLWNVEWGADGFTPGTGTVVNGLTASTYSLTTLTAGTAYDYYVQTDCGGIQSTWSGPYSFTTTTPGSACTDPIIANVGINHADNSTGDKWFIFTAPGDGNVRIFTCGHTTEDTRLWAYAECPGVTAIASSDDDCSTQSDDSFVVTSGTNYYILWGDNYTTSDYDFEITYTPFSTETDILTYSFPEQTGPATINPTAHTVNIEVGNGTVMTGLVATFTLSTGADAAIAAVPQVSGTTANNFTAPVTYTITAEDGTTTQDWVVTVTEAVVNTETDFLTFGFDEQTGAATIDATAHTIAVEINQCADITTLTADFTLSFGADAEIATVAQTSGVTVNDFTAALTYTITAEDGTTTQNWVVTVTQIPSPVETVCASAFAYDINDPAYTSALCPNTPLYVAFTLDQDYENVVITTDGSDFDTQLAYFTACVDIVNDMTTSPANPTNNLGYDDDGGAGTQSLITETTLAAGTYIAVIYGYTTASGNVQFTVTGTPPPTPVLTWSATSFTEAAANDGSISTVVNLTLTDETFATVGTLVDGADFLNANVPAGLTVSIVTTSTTAATVTLTGNATAHQNINDVANMDITFLNPAFTGGVASDVLNYSQSAITVDFNDNAVVVINEVDCDQTATDGNEFIELYDGGFGNTSLTGMVVVLYNGATDLSYNAIDLDGYSTDANGYFVIGSALVPNVDLTSFTTNGIQNGVDAVALYMGDATSFPTNTAVTTANILDALVYSNSAAADDAGLIVLINAGQPQINEGAAGGATIHSCSRIANGTGGPLNTNTYIPAIPTPGEINKVIPVLTWSATEFDENILNDGSISTVVNLTLANETFATVGTLVEATDYTVANVPAGLTVLITNTSTTTATVELTGNAAVHMNVDDVANMDITFLDAAFTATPAALVTGYTQTTLVVDYIDVAPGVITWSGSTFTEDAANNGSISTVVTLSIANETFATIGTLVEATDYTVANVPAGLTVSIVTSDANNATITLTGNATNHENIDDIANMGITFLNAAFTGANAASVINYSNTALAVDFNNPPVLTWDVNTFVEDVANDGSISTVMNLSLTDETFATVGTLVEATDYTVANVPAGLTVVITTTGTTSATVALTGNAASHMNADDIANMGITFLDAAFTAVDALLITGSSQSAINVDFMDPYVVELTWDGTTFTEAVANDGSIGNTINLTLAYDAFTTVGLMTPGVHYNVANVPAGLTVNIAATSTTTAIIGMTGNAAAHENINDISNMEITFTDAAFASTLAADVVGFSQTGIVVDFMDVDLITDLELVFPEVINYVCDFDGTDTVPIGIQNIGETVIAAGETIDIYYTLDGGTTVVSDVITLSADLNPGDVVFDEFDAEESFLPGTYNFTIWFDYAADEVAANNTLDGQVISYQLNVDLGGVDDTIDVVSYPHTLDAHAYPYNPVYLWQDGSTNQTFEVNADGWYSVEVTDDNGCYSMDSVYVHLIDAVSEISENVSVSVYPNPNKGVFTINYVSNVSENITIVIMNAQGQVVLTDQSNSIGLTKQFDINQFADGVYYLKLTTETQNLVKKIVVQ